MTDPSSLGASTPEQENWEQRARTLLWLNHGCPPGSIYGDDGEMQCSNAGAHPPVWDFKRTPWDEIQAALFKAKLTNLAASPSPPVTQAPHREVLDKLRRDIGTVQSVAERRSDPDRDHLQMLSRLGQWQQILLDVITAAPLAPPETCEWRRGDTTFGSAYATAGCVPGADAFDVARVRRFKSCPYCLRPLSLSSGGKEMLK